MDIKHIAWGCWMVSVMVFEVLAVRPRGMFDRLDKNGDGVISKDELPQPFVFERFDLDHDGVITSREVERAAKNDVISTLKSDAGRAVPAQHRTSGPIVLSASEAGVGRHIADCSVTGLTGKTFQWSSVLGPKGLVVGFTSTTCPVSRRYLSEFSSLERWLSDREIGLLMVDPYSSDQPDEMRRFIQEHQLFSPWVHDREKGFSALLGAKTTTEVFLLDHTRTVIYRGALDDQFGLDYSRDQPRHTYLRDAVEAMLEHRIPSVVATTPPGCEIELDGKSSEAGFESGKPTYYRDVARILRQHCVRCHHAGGVAPFALEDLEAVRERARAIRRVLEEGSMPPWFAASSEHDPSRWRNDPTLPSRDRKDLLAWVSSPDKPAGDPVDAPSSLKFEGGWTMGTPDWTVTGSRYFEIPAAGSMPYQFDVVETGVTEDRWVSGYEILPEARSVVHHVLVRVLAPGQTARDESEGTGYWAAYVPGNGAHRYPDGFARKLPAGSRMTFQIHYTPNGTAVRDRVRVGLFFKSKPPAHEVRTLPLANFRISIPPGASQHAEEMTRKAPADIPILGFMPHMHMRGKSFRYEHLRADGSAEILLDIPRYDFNWQLQYDLKVPRVIPAGDKVRVVATYDNSERNRANPDPTKTVKWGPQTFDEMMIGYVEYCVPVNRQ